MQPSEAPANPISEAASALDDGRAPAIVQPALAPNFDAHAAPNAPIDAQPALVATIEAQSALAAPPAAEDQPARVPDIDIQPAPAPGTNVEPAPTPVAANAQPVPVPVIDAQPAPAAPAVDAPPAPAPVVNVQPAPALVGLRDPAVVTAIAAIAAQAVQAVTSVANAATQALISAPIQGTPLPPIDYLGYPGVEGRGNLASRLPDRMSDRTSTKYTRRPQDGGHRELTIHRTLRHIRDRDDVDEQGPARVFQITRSVFRNTRAVELAPENGNGGGDADGGDADGGNDTDDDKPRSDRETDDSQETDSTYAPSTAHSSGTDHSSSNDSSDGGSDGSSTPAGYYADVTFLNGDSLEPADADVPAANLPTIDDDEILPGNRRYIYPRRANEGLATVFSDRRAQNEAERARQNAFNMANPIYVSSQPGTPAGSSAARAAPVAGPSKKRGRRGQGEESAPAKRARRDDDVFN